MEENNQYSLAVSQIKQAILKSQYQAVKGVNAIQLSLYYGVGKYISENTRKKNWGTGALKTISSQLNKQLPGLRGFSETNMRYMRLFYESWKSMPTNSSATADELPPSSAEGVNPFVQYVIQDYNKPMGVATYTTTEEMPDRLRKALPDLEKLKKLIE